MKMAVMTDGGFDWKGGFMTGTLFKPESLGTKRWSRGRIDVPCEVWNNAEEQQGRGLSYSFLSKVEKHVRSRSMAYNHCPSAWQFHCPKLLRQGSNRREAKAWLSIHEDPYVGAL